VIDYFGTASAVPFVRLTECLDAVNRYYVVPMSLAQKYHCKAIWELNVL
jgi:hypothetical protein